MQKLQFSHCHGNHEITAMTFDPTHRRLLTAGKDGTIKIWNFNNGALLDELQVFIDLISYVNCFRVWDEETSAPCF